MTSFFGPNVVDSVNVIYKHTNANLTLIQLHVDVLVSHIFEFFPVFLYSLTLEEWHLELWPPIMVAVGPTLVHGWFCCYTSGLACWHWPNNIRFAVVGPTLATQRRNNNLFLSTNYNEASNDGPTHDCIIIFPNIIVKLYNYNFAYIWVYIKS